MRKLALLAFLALGSAVPLTAQQRAWSGAFAAGYGTGTGSAFSGKGAIWATAAGFLPLSSTVRGGLELGYHRFDTIESRIPDELKLWRTNASLPSGSESLEMLRVRSGAVPWSDSVGRNAARWVRYCHRLAR